MDIGIEVTLLPIGIEVFWENCVDGWDKGWMIGWVKGWVMGCDKEGFIPVVVVNPVLRF